MTTLATQPHAAGPADPDGQPEQRRILVTDLPGPRSRELQQRRDGALPPGLGKTLAVFVDRAGGGIIVDVDGNHLIDFASGIAVTSVGASAPEVVRRVQVQAAKFTHTCFLVTEYEGYVEVADWLNKRTPGDHPKTTALFSTGAEAIENAVKIARASTGRPGVVVFDHAYHGRSLLTMAMTAKEKPYKAGFGPLATDVHRAPFPYPLRWPTGPERAAEEALAALEELLEQRRTRDDRRHRRRAGAGRGRLHRACRRVPSGGAGDRPPARHRPRRRRGSKRNGPHRRPLRQRARGRRARRHRHRQGAGRRPAAFGGDRPGGDHGRRRTRRPRRDVCRQPARLRRRPRRVRDGADPRPRGARPAHRAA